MTKKVENKTKKGAGMLEDPEYSLADLISSLEKADKISGISPEELSLSEEKYILSIDAMFWRDPVFRSFISDTFQVFGHFAQAGLSVVFCNVISTCINNLTIIALPILHQILSKKEENQDENRNPSS